MSEIKIEAAQLEGLFREDLEEVVTEDDVFREVDRGGWDDEGKYQYLPVYIESKKTKKVYVFNVQRSGSYFSDYYYEVYGDCYEVEKKEITVSTWVPVPKKLEGSM